MSLLKRNVGSHSNHLTFATEEEGGRLTNLDLYRAEEELPNPDSQCPPDFFISFFERIFSCVLVADKLFFGRDRSASEPGENSKYTFLRREGLRWRLWQGPRNRSLNIDFPTTKEQTKPVAFNPSSHLNSNSPILVRRLFFIDGEFCTNLNNSCFSFTFPPSFSSFFQPSASAPPTLAAPLTPLGHTSTGSSR